VSASLIKTDTTTEGAWMGPYGTQGYDIIGGATSLPSYATVTPSGAATYTWSTASTDPRALQNPGGTGGTAACWYSATSFTVDVNLTDGQAHDLALYFLDFDSRGRSEQVQISNAATGAVLDTETVSSFSAGVYLQWAVTGNVLITITNKVGINAVLSGLFFDPTPTQAPTPTITATAAFVKPDPTTQGNGIGIDGTQGDDVIGTLASQPGYAAMAPAAASAYTWVASTAAPQVLQAAREAGSRRIGQSLMDSPGTLS
jgi:hypothetical protein